MNANEHIPVCSDCGSPMVKVGPGQWECAHLPPKDFHPTGRHLVCPDCGEPMVPDGAHPLFANRAARRARGPRRK
jgi:hypothetical protein